jgi:hypothetical protein
MLGRDVGEQDPIDIYVPGDAGDPGEETVPPEGTVIRRGPPLHPDDVVIGPGGVPVTSVSRTLIDLAEVMDADELRGCFERAQEQGLLDLEALAASRSRVEWRPSLAMLDTIIAEYRSADPGT